MPVLRGGKAPHLSFLTIKSDRDCGENRVEKNWGVAFFGQFLRFCGGLRCMKMESIK